MHVELVLFSKTKINLLVTKIKICRNFFRKLLTKVYALLTRFFKNKIISKNASIIFFAKPFLHEECHFTPFLIKLFFNCLLFIG